MSQGIDLFIKYRTDNWSSWLSYTYLDSKNQFSYLNEGDPYPSTFGQNHEINFVNMYKLKNWEFGSTFIFGSGKYYTPPYEEEGGFFLEYDLDRINARRLPAYHRLDFSAKYSFDFGPFECESGITLFNVYNRRNIRNRRFTQDFVFEETGFDEDLGGRFETVQLDTELLGFTPNFFFNLKF